MKLSVLGGPHDGSSTEVPDNLGEGQGFTIDSTEYFVHYRNKGKGPILIYYTSSLEF